jgi:phage gp29-like protein
MAEVVLYGPDGEVLDRSALKQEIAGPTLTGVRQVYSNHPSQGLDPIRLGAILREAEDGDPTAYLELAEDLEEKDLRYSGVLQTRKLAVSQMEISVIAAGDDAQSKADADFVRTWIGRGELQQELVGILDALGKGFSVTEIMWDTSGAQWLPAQLRWRDPRWFRFDPVDGETLRLLDAGGQLTPLPAFKFIRHVARSKSGLPVRGGLARKVCWYTMFKSFGIKDWIVFMETYGHPLRVGKYGPNASAAEKATLLRAVRSIASDAGAIIPASMQIEFVNAQTQGQPTVHQNFVAWADTQISILVLGQNLTTEVKGGSLAAAEQHGDVKREICQADANALASTLNRDLVRPMIDLNFGPRKAYPALKIAYPEEEDVGELLKNVQVFVGMGGKIGASVVRDKMGLPEPAGDDELLQPSRPAIAAPAGKEQVGEDQAEQAPARRKTAIASAQAKREDMDDRLAAQLDASARTAMDSAIDKLRALVNDPTVTSLDDLGARLLDAYPEMDMSDLADLLTRVMALGDLAGRQQIQDGVNPLA